MTRFVLVAWLAFAAAAQEKIHDICAACHNQHLDDLQGHKHFARGLSCDACHGASKEHRESNGGRQPDRVAGPVEQPALCGTCHAAQAKPYTASKHGLAVAARAEKKAAACTTCHGTHAVRKPAAMRTQCARCHDPLPATCRAEPAAEGKLACASCHDPHALKTVGR